MRTPLFGLRKLIYRARSHTKSYSYLQVGHRSKIHGLVLIPPSKVLQRKPCPLAPLAGPCDTTLQPNEPIRVVQLPDANSLLLWRGLRREIRWDAPGSLRVRLEDCHRDCKISTGLAAFLPTVDAAVPDDGAAACRGIEVTLTEVGATENGIF